MATNRRIKFKDNKDFVYVVPFIPIGYIFETTNPDDPKTYYGGTWEYFGQGKVMVGYDPNDADFKKIGATGGEKKHILTISEMPEHKHDGSYWGGSPLVYTYSGGGNNRVLDLAGSGIYWRDNCDLNRTTKINTGVSGSNQPHNNLQPYIVVYRWRKIAY